MRLKSRYRKASQTRLLGESEESEIPQCKGQQVQVKVTSCLFLVFFNLVFRSAWRGRKMSASWLWQVRLQRFSLEDRDPLNCFNEHVKGPLRALVESQIGSELHVPFHIALTACLPMIFYSSVNVLACDNGPCETSAVLSGYSSVTQYMVTQVVGWTLTIFLSFPVTSPILLRMINFVVSCSDGPLELFMALLCCPLAYVGSQT